MFIYNESVSHKRLFGQEEFEQTFEIRIISMYNTSKILCAREECSL